MNEFSALDQEYLDEESQKNIEDYLCCICQLIPNYHTAIEEKNCGHIFCLDCFTKWEKKNSQCPFCKSNISTRNIEQENKLVYRFLINLIVKCQKENCKWKGPWNELGHHIKKEHKENNINEDLIFIKKQFYKSKIHKHELQFLGKTKMNWKCDGEKYDICKSCLVEENKVEDIGQFNCKECNFNLCEKCMRIYYSFEKDSPNKSIINNNNNIINENNNSNNNIQNNSNNNIQNNRNNNSNSNSNNIYEYRKKDIYELNKSYLCTEHKHLLKYLGVDESGWACDGRKLEDKCASGITDYNQTKNIPRFNCAKCDFDLCLKCMDKYLIKSEDHIIDNEYTSPQHKHPLKYIGIIKDKWRCDSKGLFHDCFSNISELEVHPGIPRFRCDECDFDICINCFDYYSKVNTEHNCCIF